MATLANLADRVRVELGDLGKTFVTTFTADGTTNRFDLQYAPLNESLITVTKNGTTLANTAYGIEESTGIMVLTTTPTAGDTLVVAGTYYRYFTATEINNLVADAISTHTTNHTDSVGRAITIDSLPANEEYPVTVHAVTLALYTLATDAAFDIDIQAPDGVTIPRAERYRQLMEMVQARQEQYRELCMLLGIGLYRIDVLSLNRISKATGRLIPVYKPQEVDDRSYPERVHIPHNIYGDKPAEWPTTAQDITSYQGRSFSTSLDFTANYAGKSFTANLLNQRGSVLVVQNFGLTVTAPGIRTVDTASRTASTTTTTLTTTTAHGLSAGNSVVITGVNTTVDGTYTVATIVSTTSFAITTSATTALSLTGLTGQVETNVAKDYTFTLTLTKDQTLRLAEHTYWSLSTVDYFTAESVEIEGGNFYTVRSSTVVL